MRALSDRRCSDRVLSRARARATLRASGLLAEDEHRAGPWPGLECRRSGEAVDGGPPPWRVDAAGARRVRRALARLDRVSASTRSLRARTTRGLPPTRRERNDAGQQAGEQTKRRSGPERRV